jgi:prepilin-type N-terminal cleavage/methylation domain-containing protein
LTIIKKYLKVNIQMKNRGFTLIELLIVIGVLGILATGLLAAVDPFEQLKKGRDTNRRNVVVEIYNANIRYYATHGDLPWNEGTCDDPDFDANGAQSIRDIQTSVEVGGGIGCITPLIDDGELKEDFMSALSDEDEIFMYSPTDVSLSVCFSPESKSIYNDEATRYAVDGTLTADCEVDGDFKELGPGNGTGLCYWCAK